MQISQKACDKNWLPIFKCQTDELGEYVVKFQKWCALIPDWTVAQGGFVSGLQYAEAQCQASCTGEDIPASFSSLISMDWHFSPTYIFYFGIFASFSLCHTSPLTYFYRITQPWTLHPEFCRNPACLGTAPACPWRSSSSAALLRLVPPADVLRWICFDKSWW